ncbi:MAG: ATP-binding protein [Spirochaetota bacterium]|nr:ATP-binding protein [Spirochaetota bacterium]
MTRPHILLVEDESIVAMDMSRRLISLGYPSVEYVATGEAAVAYAVEHKPDLILMDIHLKGKMDGIQAAELIRRQNDIPLIYITAYADEKTFARAKETEPYGFIMKPFQEREVRSSIEIALYKHTIQKELLQAKIDAEQANNAKSRFLTMMSHELRTPLNSILGMTQLAMESKSPAEQLEYIKIAHQEGRNLLSLINTIIDYAQMESGQTVYKNEDFHLDRVAEEIMEIYREGAESRHIEFSLNLEKDGPLHLHGDTGKIKQIFMNIIGNAVKFTARGSVAVRIRTRSNELDDTVQLYAEIEDTGCGIPVKEQTEIFSAFRQGDNSYTRMYGGVGLGLTAVKQMVDTLGGSIEFESAPDVGTVFRIYLVLRRALGIRSGSGRGGTN